MATILPSATCALVHSMPERAECELLHNKQPRMRCWKGSTCSQSSVSGCIKPARYWTSTVICWGFFFCFISEKKIILTSYVISIFLLRKPIPLFLCRSSNISSFTASKCCHQTISKAFQLIFYMWKNNHQNWSFNTPTHCFTLQLL